MKALRREDGRRSWTLVVNFLALAAMLALDFLDADGELEAAVPWLRTALLYVVAVANMALRTFRTDGPLALRSPTARRPLTSAIVLVGLGALVLGVGSACGAYSLTCERLPDGTAPTYRFDESRGRTVLAVPCDDDPDAVEISWPGKVRLRTSRELAPEPPADCPDPDAGDDQVDEGEPVGRIWPPSALASSRTAAASSRRRLGPSSRPPRQRAETGPPRRGA